jgi:hypothetical protein
MKHDRNLMCQREHLFFICSLYAPIVHLPSSPFLMLLPSTSMPLSFVSIPFNVHLNTPLFLHTHPYHSIIMIGLLKNIYRLVVLHTSPLCYCLSWHTHCPPYCPYISFVIELLLFIFLINLC